MVHGYGNGLDTPRTNIGDATYLDRQPDLGDITQEPSFQSPAKDGNLLNQLRNGGRPTLRTPRGNNRQPLIDRRNMPAGLGGGEFTPLLKSATRNSARRGPGKENGVSATPAFLDRIDEDMTPLPAGQTSIYGGSRNTSSYADATPMPVQDDTSSVASTPLIMRRRDTKGGGPLEDGNQLSLREQENVIDRIEKENFGLKLKIHFLEEALRKAGPGFSEAALRENTELKVDKVQMQRDLQRYKKHLSSAEKDLENYRQQIVEVQEKAKETYASEGQREELEKLRQVVEEKDHQIGELHRQLDQEKNDNDQLDKLHDDLEDLEAELRQKDNVVTQYEDELEDLKLKLDQADEEARDSKRRLEELERKAGTSEELESELEDLKLKLEQAEDKAKADQRRMMELEQKAQKAEELDEAKDTIEDLEADIRKLQREVESLTDKMAQAISDKEEAEDNLEELQEELANKSMVTKGLSRQVEEKIARLQTDLEKSRQEYAALEKEHQSGQKDNEELKLKLREARQDYQQLQKDLEQSRREGDELNSKMGDTRSMQKQLESSRRELEELRTQMTTLRQERDESQRARQSLGLELKVAQKELNAKSDEKNLLQTRHDALTNESASLQQDVRKLEGTVGQLQKSLEQEQQHALDLEKDIRAQYKAEMDRLNDEISDLQADLRERDNLYDNDSEKWETERHNLESERDRAEERAAGLQKTIDKLREAEGSLSSKESKMQEALQMENDRHKKEEAVLSRQIEELQQNLEDRQRMLEDLRNEVSTVRDALRQSQLDYRSQTEKVGALEDEVEVLQATIDEESEKANHELEQARRKSEILEEELRLLRQTVNNAQSSTTASQEASKATNENLARLKFQLADANESVAKATKDKQALQDQVAHTNIELHSLRGSLAEAKAERDELEAELRKAKSHDEDTFRLDHERLELRATKTRLENEVRRLKDENNVLTSQRSATQKMLENEIETAAAEEDRLNREILELQKKSRPQHPVVDSQELTASRRRIRELERQIDGYEAKIAELQMPPPEYHGDSNSDMSMVRRDLDALRQNEKELLKREALHKETVKSLKRQIADLERTVHDAEMARLMVSPSTSNGSAQKSEVNDLRRELMAAHRTANDLKKALREADRKAASSEDELMLRLEGLESEKATLEQELEEVQQLADEAAVEHEKKLDKYRRKLQLYKEDRDQLVEALREQLDNQDKKAKTSSNDHSLSLDDRRDLYAMLRESQLAADKLEREVREHRDAIDEMSANEAALRKKLERARSERAAYRAGAEKLQRDVKALTEAREKAEAAAKEAQQAMVLHSQKEEGGGDTDAIIRAAEAAEKKHKLELRGMCMQLEWMRARFDRELRLRSDAAFAKKYLLLQLEIRDACNKADLVILNDIAAQLRKGKHRTTTPAIDNSLKSLSHHKTNTNQALIPHSPSSSYKPSKTAVPVPPKTRLKRALIAVRFVVRMQLGAREWAKHAAVGERLREAVEEMKKEERIRKMRAEYRAQVAARGKQQQQVNASAA